ncbi:MAG: hypothetical protein PHY92_09500 [Alphaproteobacteria bacterium]|nr:hypothetical protein [Alphaproteobacteria bacterium]
MTRTSCSCGNEIDPGGAADWPLETLKEALRDALRPKKSYCMIGSLHVSTSPMDGAGIIFDSSDDPEFRNRFNTALLEMLASIDLTEKGAAKEDVFYTAELITAVAWFLVPDAGDKIKDKILSRKYMNIPEIPYALPAIAPDLHYILLHALLDYPDIRNIPVYETFFSERNGRYANMCYRGLWESDYEYGIQYLPRLAAFYLENTEMPGKFSVEFGFFLDKHFSAFWGNGLDRIKQNCQNKEIYALIHDELNRFRQTIPELGTTRNTPQSSFPPLTPNP